MASMSLLRCIDQLRVRWRRIHSTTSLGWALVAALTVLVAAAWADAVLDLPARVRAGVWALALLGAVLVALAGIWRSVRKGTVPAMARRLDALAGSQGQILAGVDLASAQPNAAWADSSLSEGLASIAVHRAARLAGGVARAQAVPARPLRTSYGTLGLLLAAVGLVGLFMPRLAQTQWLRLFDPFGDHPPYSRVVFEVRPGDAAVVYGSGLDITVTTQGPPVEDVELVLQSDANSRPESLPMFPVADRKWTTSVAGVTSPSKYFVRARSSRSRQFKIEVITVPRLAEVRFRETPPAYTRRAAYEGPLPQGGLAGLPGTKVEVWAKSNRPLSGGSLQMQFRAAASPERAAEAGREPIPLVPVAGASQEVAGSFEIRRPARFDLKVTDVAGQHSQETFTGTVTVLADEAPSVRVTQPQAQSFATPDVTLPVVVSAEDDYGISRVQLYRSLNDSRALAMDLAVPQPAPARWADGMVLPLTSYGLQPGDVIKLYARAEDNDPAGAKGAESSVVRVQIISQQDFERLMRTRQGMQMLSSKYQQAGRRLENLGQEAAALAKELEQLDPESTLAEQKREQLRRLAERLEQEAEAVRKAAEHVLPYDVDRKLTEQLEKLAEQLGQAAAGLKPMTAGAPPRAGAAAKALRELAQQLAGNKQQLQQQAIEPLEHLAAIYPLIEDESRFVALYLRQRDLAERLASLEGRDGEDDAALKNRMRDLELEQRKIRDDLRELLDDIEEHANRLPDDPRLEQLRQGALEFAQAVRNSGASEAMARAEAGLAEFSGTRGHANALRAADILETFLAKCSGSMGPQGMAGQCLGFQPSLAQCLGNTVSQLLADAGLLGLKPGAKPGFGGGTAAGGGYSARRSTLQNVGLYGNLPTFGGAESGFGTGPFNQRGAGALAGRGDGASQPAILDAMGELRAAGAGSAVVPQRYRQRVAKYFQRIAEETGGR